MIFLLTLYLEKIEKKCTKGQNIMKNAIKNIYRTLYGVSLSGNVIKNVTKEAPPLVKIALEQQ